MGEELRVAILFADIRGFTAFSEALLPYDVIHELQRHLQQVTRAVERHGGVVTSYMGDGVMALFAPDKSPSSSLRAARAGIELRAHADRRRGELDELYGRSCDVNVGLHCGPAIVGTLWGSPPTLTAIGDSVNLATARRTGEQGPRDALFDHGADKHRAARHRHHRAILPPDPSRCGRRAHACRGARHLLTMFCHQITFAGP